MVLCFVLELSRLGSLKGWIAVLAAMATFVLLGGLSLTSFSQAIKALLLPLICLSFYGTKLPGILVHTKDNFLTAFIILSLLSVPFEVRLPFGTYLDAGTGIFRHSVDFAIFTILAMHYLFRYSGLPAYLSIVVLIPGILMGSSRSLLGLLPLYLTIKRPLVGVGLLLFSFFAFFLLFDFLDEFVPNKILALINLIIAGNIGELSLDGSLMVRISNFVALYQNMSGLDWLFGLPRDAIVSITSQSSNGDVATDNIVLYKCILFGIPFGLLLVTAPIFSVWLLSRDLALFTVLIVYGMLQDWLSNAFCIYVIYVFIRLFNQNSLDFFRIKNVQT